MRVEDPVDPLRRAHAVDPQPSGDTIDGDFGAAAIEPRLAAEKIVGIAEAKEKTGVGDRRLVATVTVAGGARLGTCTLGSDMEDAAVIDARNRAAARANAGDIQALQGDALSGDAPVRAYGCFAAGHQRDIGGGSTHIEGDEVAVPVELGGVLAAGNAAGRTGEYAAGRQPHRFRDAGDAAVRLDDQDRRVEFCRTQTPLQTEEITFQRRADVGVDDGGRDALVLLDLG